MYVSRVYAHRHPRGRTCIVSVAVFGMCRLVSMSAKIPVIFKSAHDTYTTDHGLLHHSWFESDLLAVADHNRNAKRHR